MIDHRYRAIFFHQRKVAGMAIAKAWGFTKHHIDNLGNNFHRYNEGVLSWDWDKRPPVERTYFIFSAVRNPFDRAISSWKFVESTRHRTLLDALQNPPREKPDYEHFTRPQIDIMRDPQTGKIIVDDLIRFETLQQDFDRICDKIGRPRTMLEHINTGPRDRGYRQYFDAQTRRLVEEMFADDLKTFGYEF